MSSSFYQLYIDGIMTLTKSLVIKSSKTAEMINDFLIAYGHNVSLSEPETWKYYLNLNGQYHETDKVMTIVSMDTLETIEFTKENLAIHLATRDNYVQGTQFTEELIRQYPDQELLINGIITSVDINTAINAKDGTILAYNELLVEENELNLIPKLQEWITGFHTRWNLTDYSITDELYPAAFLGILYLNIPPVIINLRLENCHTQYVHSFHVREFLASNGRLDAYLDFLTTKQALWLYRNIRYLQRNAGKQTTFRLLVDNLLTERGFPLVAYDMRHNLENIVDDIYPETELSFKYLNFGSNDSIRTVRTLNEILDKQIVLADGNFEEIDLALDYIPGRFKNSPHNEVSTKVLESIITDVTSSSVYSLEDMLLNHWLYLSTHDRYVAFITTTNPSTGNVYTLSVKEAFTLFLYCFNRSNNVILEDIPIITATGIKRPTTPTIEELLTFTDTDYVPVERLEAILADHPPMGVYISRAAFYNYCVQLHDLHERLYYITGREEHMLSRGMVENINNKIWFHDQCTLVEGLNYEQWFELKGFEMDNLTPLECSIMAADILEEATGYKANQSRSLRELQRAMLDIMTQLSSYTVHYLQTINADEFLKSEWAAIRPGDYTDHWSDTWYAYFEPIDLTDCMFVGSSFIDHDEAVNQPLIQDVTFASIETSEADIGIGGEVVEKVFDFKPIYIGGIDAVVNDLNIPPETNDQQTDVIVANFNSVMIDLLGFDVVEPGNPVG